MSSIPLAKVIQDLRHELSESMKVAVEENLRFAVDTLELELQVTIAGEGSVGGKVSFLVWNVEASGKASRSDVHTIKLTLRPITAAGGPVAVSDLVLQKPARPEEPGEPGKPG